MSNPWIKFYPSDWRADPALRMCSLGARGLWMEMLCLMHEAGGYLTVNGKELLPRQLAALSGASLDEVNTWLVELSDAGVFSRNEAGVIYSRRMLKDLAKAATDKANGRAGGSPKLTGGYNIPGYIYLMGVRADGAYKIGISTNPANRLKKVRAQYPGQDIRVLNFWPVDDMGAVEAYVHRMFSSKKHGEWFFLNGDDVETLERTLKGHLDGAHKAQKPEARSQIPEPEKKEGESAPDGTPPGDAASGDVIVPFPKAQTRKAERAIRLPDDFTLTAERLAFALKEGLTHEKSRREFDKFVDHHGARGNRFVCWDRAWQNWVRKAADGFGGPVRASSGGHGSPSGGRFAAMQRALARVNDPLDHA